MKVKKGGISNYLIEDEIIAAEKKLMTIASNKKKMELEQLPQKV
jgi:hypothetical protein